MFLNNGSLGIAPKPVTNAVARFIERSAALDIEEYPRWGYERMDEHRTALAAYLGCQRDDVTLTHNATEAIGIVASGLDLKAGDEVLTTNQEHPSGRGAWQVRRARHGVEIREVEIPLPPKSPEQLADLLISAIGPRTRVLSFSGITTTTGLIMPMRDICRAAREKGVITLVDGAHVHGQIHAPINQMECDFLAGSPHKWMFAPAGCGFLYARPEMQERIWPSVTTTAWSDKSMKGARLMQVGTNNRALFEGLLAGLDFANRIGPDLIYKRIHALAKTVRERASGMPEMKLLTPDDDRMFGSLVTMQMPEDHGKRFAELCRKRRIWITGGARFRVSTHIHTRPEDIDELFKALEETRKA